MALKIYLEEGWIWNVWVWREPEDLQRVDLHACGWTCSPRHPPLPSVYFRTTGKIIRCMEKAINGLYRLGEEVNRCSVVATHEVRIRSGHIITLSGSRSDSMTVWSLAVGERESQELLHEDQDIRYDLSSTQRHAVLGKCFVTSSLSLHLRGPVLGTGRVQQRGRGTSLHSHSWLMVTRTEGNNVERD